MSQADVDRLSEEIADLSAAVEDSGPSQAELDAQKCAAALEALGSFNPSGSLRFIPDEITDAIDEYC